MDPLFPELPEDLAALGDEELQTLIDEHAESVRLIRENDTEFIGELSGNEVIEQLRAGVEQVRLLRAEQTARSEREQAYAADVEQLAAEVVGEDDTPEAEAEVEAEASADESEESEDEAEAEAEAEAEEVQEEEVPVLAAAETSANTASSVRLYRRPPAPSADRQPPAEQERTRLVAAAGPAAVHPGTELTPVGFAEALLSAAGRLGRPSKHTNGTEERYLIASAEYPFPAERRLLPADIQGNNEKIRAIGSHFLGGSNNPFNSEESLVASGGLCAPLTPFYAIPDFAVTDRPVRDALPSFQAERGGVSVPSVSTIGDITTAITIIEEADDALGGTFATKSCQDMECATWTDVAVGIISHCREYGNMNARAWPEGIAHENNLTMAAHARAAEERLLARIKALSINVTQAAIGAQLNTYASLVYALTRMQAATRYRLRLARSTRYRVIAPEWLPDALAADVSATQFDRFQAQEQMAAHLSSLGINISWYKDDVGSGTSQGFSDETASAIDDFPDEVQFAFFVEGEFLHLDGGVLELGLVRDSTLNSTNDYQVFGETFENVARVGPTQGALWATVDICPSGAFPALVTGLTC